jgi:hypothetical protein
MAKKNVGKIVKNAAITGMLTGGMGAVVNRMTMPTPVEKTVATTIRNNDGTVGTTQTGTGEFLNQAAMNLHNSQTMRDVLIGAGIGLGSYGVAHALGRQWQKKQK